MANNGWNAVRIWWLVFIFSLIFTMGSCIACNKDMKTEYGSEELYRTSSGQIKSAPITNTTGPDNILVYMTLGGVLLSIVSGYGWTKAEEVVEKRDREG
jgi:hypothetical protein